MIRMKLQLPKGEQAEFTHQDLVHDALINAMTKAGASIDDVLGYKAEPWTFAALGRSRKSKRSIHTIVVSSPSSKLEEFLKQLKTEDVRYARAKTGEMLDFSKAAKFFEQDPIPPGGGIMGVLMLSPLAISEKGVQPKRWIKKMDQVDLGPALNLRLTKIAKRPVNLKFEPDSLYVRANPEHSVLVKFKSGKSKNGQFVIGMNAPMVLSGSEEDLRMAWYSGLGEKTRIGFGLIGLVEKGVGR